MQDNSGRVCAHETKAESHGIMAPFLKWAGGKRWLARQISDLMPPNYNRYFEPFLGSGAIFFTIRPQAATLSDSNVELIETYKALCDYPTEIFEGLQKLHWLHTKELYYRIRGSAPSNSIDSAVRFIYLNRTCWNGLYRVNRKNEFNVPIGTKENVVFSDDDFGIISEILNGASINCCDFEDTINSASCGDLIYVDPPYTVKHNFNGFLKYNQVIFSWEDQIRLKDSLISARDRGCSIIVSNADHPSVRDLYSDFEFRSIPRASVIAGRSQSRGATTELLVIHHG